MTSFFRLSWAVLIPALALSLSVSDAAAQSASPAQATSAQIGAAPAPAALPKRESMIDVSQIEGQVRESAIRKIGDVVQAHPEEAMAIVRTWLHQPV